VIAVTSALLLLVYRGDADRRAVVVSGVVALLVQLAAFAIAFAMARTNVMAGWGLGSIVRLVALAVYALLLVPSFALPLNAALVSLALFLFLSTLIEPFFLKTT
jgi:hypothetical protein